MQTILIVDDDAALIRSIRICLESKGYRVIEANNGNVALDYLKVLHPAVDIVITDFSMPIFNGMDLLKKIKRDFKKMPVILATAYAEKDLVLDAWHSQCDGFLEKPFTLSQLFNEIDRINNGKRQQPEISIIDEVLPTIVNQINDPLTAIIGNAELGLNHLEEKESIRKNFDFIIEATKRLEIFNKQITRLGSTLSPKKKERIDLVEIVDKTLSLFASVIELHDVTIEKLFDCEKLFIHGVRFSLEQVLFNLISNAIDAMAESSNRILSLCIQTHRESQKVVSTVSDTGHGISERSIKKIFNPYFTEKKNGNGLGLYVVRSIIQQHTGTISVESVEGAMGQGTTFTITLPLLDFEGL